MLKKCILFCAFAAAATLIAAPAVAVPSADRPSQTLDNLMTAYNGESNAHARYLAFATKADTEGYGKVAGLFRAAARAEEIHAQNHAAAIAKLGGVAKAVIAPADVKSTKENLEAAIQGETYERDTMYPEFLKAARAAGEKGAVQTLNYAKTAEAEHAKLYQEALNNLDQMKGESPKYYVCTVCGYTVKVVDFKKCPSCFNGKDKYVVVT